MKYMSGMIACVILALVPVILWATTGRHFATRYECQSAVCETKVDCVCTESNGCLNEEKKKVEDAAVACKPRKLCYSHQDQKYKLNACNAASDCVDDEYTAASDWDCRDAKQCFDTEFEDYVKDAEAPLLSCFQFGLTPSGLVDGVLPSSGGLMGLAALLFILGRRRQA